MNNKEILLFRPINVNHNGQSDTLSPNKIPLEISRIENVEDLAL